MMRIYVSDRRPTENLGQHVLCRSSFDYVLVLFDPFESMPLQLERNNMVSAQWTQGTDGILAGRPSITSYVVEYACLVLLPTVLPVLCRFVGLALPKLHDVMWKYL